jgi:hypothetical protein
MQEIKSPNNLSKEIENDVFWKPLILFDELAEVELAILLIVVGNTSRTIKI